jgi:hypothetical protein
VLAGAVAGTITSTGLEPVDQDISAEVAEFVFLGGTETITVTDETANDGWMRIDSTLGETTDFLIPTSQLIIRTATGTGNDIVTISSWTQFRAAVLIDTDGDTVDLNAPLILSCDQCRQLPTDFVLDYGRGRHRHREHHDDRRAERDEHRHPQSTLG